MAPVVYAGTLSYGQLSAGSLAGETGWTPASIVPAAGKSGRGYSPLERGGAVGPAVWWTGCCHWAVPPITEIFIAGQDDVVVLILFRDQEKQQLCLLEVQLHIPNLVNHWRSRTQIDSSSAFQTPLQLILF